MTKTTTCAGSWPTHTEQSSTPPVSGLDKWHGGDNALPELISYFNIYFGPLFVPPWWDITHCDIFPYCWRWNTGRNNAWISVLRKFISMEQSRRIHQWPPEWLESISVPPLGTAIIRFLHLWRREKHTPRWSSFNDETYSSSGRTFLQVFHHDFCTNESTALSPLLSYQPC